MEKQGDLDGARKEIEAVILAEPRDVQNLGFLAGILWQQEEREEALQLVTRAVRMQPGYEYGWAALRSWCEALEKPDYDVEVAQELTKARPNEARSWLMLALALDQPNQLEEAVAALDQGIRLDPLNVECHNQKVINLSQAGLYEEALQAAAPSIFTGDVPVELAARAAWVEGQRGNFQQAISKMEKVVKVDPDYFWGWEQVAQWYEYMDDKANCLVASTELVRLQPQNAIAWGYLGNAELQHDHIDAAIKHFKQAVQISPSYLYGSGQLVDLLIDKKEFDEATATIDFVSPHLPPEVGACGACENRSVWQGKRKQHLRA